MKLHGKEFTPLFFKGEIEMRIDFLAKQINKDYKGRNPLFIGILI